MTRLTQLLLLLILTLFFGLFETLRPVQRRQPIRERLRNIIITLVLLFVGGAVTALILTHLPWRPPIAPQHGVPLMALSVVAALFLWDLLFYWYHRAEHAVPALWRIHQLHHSDEHLNASSALRHAWLEGPLEAIIISVPVERMLHLDTTGIFLFGASTTVWLLFVHANWRLHLGALTHVIGGPQNHRIHHSSLPQHRDRNFAVYFPVIDRIFGTYHPPTRDEFPPTGTEGMRSDVPWRIALTRPFSAWVERQEKQRSP
jgi:sterol desaturase/sphingolipid hydroxylase (fatty acid hydroxylase superfamily)